MPQILQTIDEYIVKERKRDTFWLVFNTVYNDIHAFNKKLNSEDAFSLYLDKNTIFQYVADNVIFETYAS